MLPLHGPPPQPFCLKRCWQVQLLFLLRKTGSAHAEKVSAARGSGLPLGNALDERPGRRRRGGKRSRCWRHLPGSGAGSCSGPPPAGPATRRAAGPGGAALSHHWAARGRKRPTGGCPSRPQRLPEARGRAATSGPCSVLQCAVHGAPVTTQTRCRPTARWGARLAPGCGSPGSRTGPRLSPVGGCTRHGRAHTQGRLT